MVVEITDPPADRGSVVGGGAGVVAEAVGTLGGAPHFAQASESAVRSPPQLGQSVRSLKGTCLA